MGRTKDQWQFIVLMVFFACTFVYAPESLAGEAPPTKGTDQSAAKPDDARKIKTKVAPVYPQIAHNMHLAGTVRVLVVITPAGVVKSVRPLGGHPLLLDSAMEAVKRWKYETGPQETTTVVEFKFSDEGS